MIKVILFDMDGTLIDSDALVLSIYNKLINKYPPKTDFSNLDLGDVFASSYPDVLIKLYGEVKELHLQEIYRLHKELKHQYLRTFEGVDTMLEQLKKNGYRLGLLTSEMRSIAMDELGILKIDQYFDHVLAFDDVKKPKPHPDGIFEHMKFFGCSQDEIIYIGDQKSDGLAANSASIYSILLDWSQKKSLDYQRQFDHVAHDTVELMRIIESKNKMVIRTKKDKPLRILQLTDLHLMNDEKDIQTYQLISDMISFSHPDFIVFTGDQTMSKDAVMLYQKLGEFMDQFKVPFSYVFGNHDTEGDYSYQQLIDAISPSKYLMFDQGPSHLGFSNCNILIKDESEKPIGSLIMLDTHIDDFYMINGTKTWGYGSLSKDQISWYEGCVNRYPLPHLIFYHIPIPEVKEVSPSDDIHKGDYFESPCTPPINTGFFDVAKNLKHAKAMFFGHDHLNDYSYSKDGILLAYGRVSGHYDYAMPGFPKGARLIQFDHQGHVTSQIILHKDLIKSSKS